MFIVLFLSYRKVHKKKKAEKKRKKKNTDMQKNVCFKKIQNYFSSV